MERDPLDGVNPNILKSLIPNAVIDTWNKAMDESEKRIGSDGMVSEEDERRLVKIEDVAKFFGIDIYKW